MSLALLVTGTLGMSGPTAVKFALFGDEIQSSPANTFKTLAQGSSSVAAAAIYTVTGPVTQTIVKTMVFSNTAGTASAVVIYANGLVAVNQIFQATIPANGTLTYGPAGWQLSDSTGTTITTGAPITATGDATGVQSGSTLPLVLATVNGAPGTFGSATQVAQVAVNAKGLSTTVSNVSIQIAESQVTNLVSDLAGKQATGNYITALTGDVAATGPGSVAATLATFGPGTGTVGSATQVAVVTPDAKGRINTLTATSIQIAESQVTNLVADLAAKVAGTRLINTTLPLTGGGDLSADRTLAINAATTSAPGSLSAVDFGTMHIRTFRPQEYGTLDYTGATSSNAAFAAMMTAINSFNDRLRVEFPPGVFLINSGTLNFSSVTAPMSCGGAGRENTVLLCANTTGDMVTAPNTDGAWFHDFAIYQGGTPNTAGNGLNTAGCDDILIERMFFVNQFVDINVQGNAFKVNIQSTRHSQTNGSATSVGILVTNGAVGDTYIGPDVVMSNTGATRRRACVEIVQCGHYEITMCNLTGSQYGVILDPGAGQIVADGFHTNLLCDSNTVAGMLVNAATSTSTIKSIKSTNSWYCGTVAGAGTAGVITQGTAGGIINGITHVNDRFLNNQTHGYQHGFGTDIRLIGCDIRGNSAAGSAVSDGFNAAAGVSNWSITGGKSGGTDGAPTGGNQRYGINIVSGAGTLINITGVDVTGNVTGGINNASTAVADVLIRGNTGYLPGTGLLIPLASGGASVLGAGGRGAVTSGTTNTFLGTIKVGANFVQGLTQVRIRLIGQTSAAGVPTYNFYVGANGTTADTLVCTIVQVAQVASGYQVVDCTLFVPSSGSVVGHGFATGGAAVASQTAAAEVTATPTMSSAWFITYAAACATTGTWTVKSVTVEAV